MSAGGGGGSDGSDGADGGDGLGDRLPQGDWGPIPSGWLILAAAIVLIALLAWAFRRFQAAATAALPQLG